MLERLTAVGSRIADELYYLRVCHQAGLVRLDPPRTFLEVAKVVRRHGMLGGGTGIAAIRHGDRTAIIDERGSLTYREVEDRANAVANALIARGVKAGDGVAILARNHRGFLDATFGCAKVGARMIFLNTDFAGPQIREVAQREGGKLLICDDEYVKFLEGFEPPLGRLRAWTDDDEKSEDTLEGIIATGDTTAPPKPEQNPSIVILTSGTTGTPKGAPRDEVRSLSGPGALLSKAPFKAEETTVIATPLFHSLGFAHAIAGVALGSTIVLRRRFNPEHVLEDIATNRASALIVVPIMLRRILDLGKEKIDGHDLSSLRIVFVSGSQLGGELCKRGLDLLGPVIYNLYGSTEVAYATIATPEDLLAAPDCVGQPPRGTKVRIVDDKGNDVPRGETGRIFVGNIMSFTGYTSGEHKELLADGLMSSGDVGHFDEGGRLFIDGRDDDMIVSGGENVFPQEIEELLDRHEAIREVAVIGVDDDSWGKRLAAHIVLHDGQELSEDDVKAFVKEHLARFKVPRDVIFRDELPRNPTGKILKRELRQEGSSPAPR
jgi:fatty-acyl-CoA synthase